MINQNILARRKFMGISEHQRATPEPAAFFGDEPHMMRAKAALLDLEMSISIF